jgi:hypothetical protein
MILMRKCQRTIRTIGTIRDRTIKIKEDPETGGEYRRTPERVGEHRRSPEMDLAKIYMTVFPP